MLLLLLLLLLLALVALAGRWRRLRPLLPEETDVAKPQAERATYDVASASAGADTWTRWCAVCKSAAFSRCGSCKAVRYCSQKCQIIHWRSGHKKECHAPTVDHHALLSTAIPEERKHFKSDHQAELLDGSTTFRSKAERLHKILDEMEASLCSRKTERKEQHSVRSSSVAFRPKPSQHALDPSRTDQRVIEGMQSEELLVLKAKLEQVTAERDALSSKVETLKSEIKKLSQPIQEGPTLHELQNGLRLPSPETCVE